MKYLLFISIFLGSITLVSAGEVSDVETPKKTVVTKDMKKKPTAFRPYSVEHKGELTPVENIESVIAGNTIVLAQPWINMKQYEIRKQYVYFNNNGKSTSEYWLNIPWSVKGNLLCMTGNNLNNCYTAYSDSKGQAYLMDQSSKLLAKVESLESGDPYKVYKAYEARQERIRARREAQSAMSAMFLGLLGEAMLSSGSGSGSESDGGCDDYCEAMIRHRRGDIGY